MTKPNYKKNITIYPFTKETIPIVLYLTKFDEQYENLHLVSPHGLSMIGKDAGWADNRLPIGITVEGDFETALAKSDMLMVTQGELSDTVHSQTLDYIKKAILLHKDIICMMTLPSQIQEECQALCETEKVSFRYCVNENDFIVNEDMKKSRSLSMYTPLTPIVFVGGLVEEANNFEVLLMMAHFLTQNGSKVSVIGDKSYCEIFGMHSLPTFIKGLAIEDSEKIRFFNLYINKIEEEEKPDLILIQVPGGMMKYNKILTGDFGVGAYLLSQAVQPDYFVCCTLYQMYGEEFAEKTSNTFFERFGFHIDCFHMSNLFLDDLDSMQKGKFFFLHVDNESVNRFVEQEKATAKIPLYNLLEATDRKKMCRSFLNDMGNETTDETVFS